MNAKYQRGLSTVQFAVAGMAMFIVLFCLLDMGRALYAYETLSEGTRRGARVAVVCPVNDPRIKATTKLGALPGLTDSNINVEYLNGSGAVVGSPSGNIDQIRFARVSVVGYRFTPVAPLISFARFNLPSFAATLPRESLGAPNSGSSSVACTGGGGGSGGGGEDDEEGDGHGDGDGDGHGHGDGDGDGNGDD